MPREVLFFFHPLLILLIMIMAEEEIGIKTWLICCGIYGFIV